MKKYFPLIMIGLCFGVAVTAYICNHPIDAGTWMMFVGLWAWNAR